MRLTISFEQTRCSFVVVWGEEEPRFICSGKNIGIPVNGNFLEIFDMTRQFFGQGGYSFLVIWVGTKAGLYSIQVAERVLYRNIRPILTTLYSN